MDDFSTRHRHALQLAQAGHFDEALAEIGAALALRPDDAGALHNQANLLMLTGRATEALAIHDRLLAIRPDRDVANNRGNALQALGRFAEAVQSYDLALSLGQAPDTLFNRGNALVALDRKDEAMANYTSALAMRPDHAETLNKRGYLWWSRHHYAEALADLEKAHALDPALPWLEGGILHLKMHAADWSDFALRKAALEDGVRAGKRVARPFMFQAVSDDPALLQVCSRIFTATEHPPRPFKNHAPRDTGKIRIGYLSGEFREQATAILMAGLYERHDRTRFEIVAVDNGGPDGSAMRARLEKAFDHWLDISVLADDAAAAAIRDAGIDILVNLNGYFGRPRMGVFALRAAPIQVNYLGFPATLGADYIDYLIADAVVIPPQEQRFHDEQIVTLPGCYQVNDNRGRPVAPIPTRAAAGLPQTGFVFCNFNQSYKLTPQTFAGWMRILRGVPGSVLWLLEGPAPCGSNLRREAQHHGIDPSRILFAPDRSPADHLARLALADLFLDGLPYNAHTTASDALWAGVPLVTRRGSAFAGRVAASILQAAGLPELVTQTQDDYEALAMRLASDPSALEGLRARLTKRDSALFDTDLFCRRIEAAYTHMWQRWLAGAPPQAFTIAD